MKLYRQDGTWLRTKCATELQKEGWGSDINVIYMYDLKNWHLIKSIMKRCSGNFDTYVWQFCYFILKIWHPTQAFFMSDTNTRGLPIVWILGLTETVLSENLYYSSNKQSGKMSFEFGKNDSNFCVKIVL